MKLVEMHKMESSIEIQELKHLKIEKASGVVSVTLIDEQGYEILKGYGKTIAESINDLHHNLL